MAGMVRCQVRRPGHETIMELTPDVCPARGVQWSPPVCVVADVRGDHFNLCPFLLGVQLLRAGSTFELDRGASWWAWLDSNDTATDSWRCICLRTESAQTPAGARLRP